MSQEALEAKIVQKVVSTLRIARHVIEKLRDGKEDGFQEEPSLSDLVLVAQIIGQTQMVDKLGDTGLPEGAEHPIGTLQAMIGPVIYPDILVVWSPDGWHVSANPDFQLQSQHCRNKEELSVVLQGVADVCASNRLS